MTIEPLYAWLLILGVAFLLGVFALICHLLVDYLAQRLAR